MSTTIKIDLHKLETAESRLRAFKETRTLELSQYCREAIKAGFISDALGTPHLYPCNETDQLNLASSVTSSILEAGVDGWVTKYWCADAKGVWAMRDHTASQIQQVGLNAREHILSHTERNADLAREVAQAVDLDAVGAVVWL